MKLFLITVVVAGMASSNALAEETGCASFKWPVAREQALFAAAPPAEAGTKLAVGEAVVLKLQPGDSVAFQMPPEREPKPGTFGAVLNLTIPTGGTIQVTLSGEAWIDVIQNGAMVKSGEFSGVKGCDGVRKSVHFDVSAGAATLQLSGAREPDIKVSVLPAQ